MVLQVVSVCRRQLLGIPFSRCIIMREYSQPNFKYVQGQYNEHDNKIREYFYAIDHNGQLFLDDARMKNFTSCFKDRKFLRFFYSRIRPTEAQPNKIHEHFRFTSHCGPERNYIRVDATPFVFTNFEIGSDKLLEYNGTGLTQEFSPSSLYVGSDGRLYHRFSHKFVSFALIKSAVADLISLNFEYEGEDDGKRPIAYKANGKSITLDYSLQDVVENTLLLR